MGSARPQLGGLSGPPLSMRLLRSLAAFHSSTSLQPDQTVHDLWRSPTTTSLWGLTPSCGTTTTSMKSEYRGVDGDQRQWAAQSDYLDYLPRFRLNLFPLENRPAAHSRCCYSSAQLCTCAPHCAPPLGDRNRSHRRGAWHASRQGATDALRNRWQRRSPPPTLSPMLYHGAQRHRFFTAISLKANSQTPASLCASSRQLRCTGRRWRTNVASVTPH